MNDARTGLLLRARALGELSTVEAEELRTRAAADRALAAELADWDEVEAALAAEGSLRDQVMAPAEAREEAGETWQRLQRAAAAAERELAARLRHGPAPAFRPLRRSALRRWLPWGALAAAAAAVVFLLLRGDDGPALLTAPPADLRAGGVVRLVLVNPVLSSDNRGLSWSAVAGAVAYEAVVVDAAGAVVLARDAALQRSTVWDLRDGEWNRLRAHRGALALRVRALDGSGVPVGSSGDLPLLVR